MLSYTIRRLLWGGVTLLLISLIIMALIRNMPGDPIALMMMGAAEKGSDKAVSSIHFERMRSNLGLDKPWYVGYFVWVKNVAQGDMGRSLYDQKPVSSKIFERMGPTLYLSIVSLILAYLISIPLGLYCTARNGRWQERSISTVLYALYSFPSFVMALYLLIFLSLKLDLLPLRGMVSDNYAQMGMLEAAWDRIKHMILPVICYSYGALAYQTRFIRSNMMEVMQQDYIRTARAKGVDGRSIMVHHAFRNALIPLVTLLGLSLPGLLGGSVILERIFNWPGMGNLYFDALSQRDYPVIMGLTMMFAVLVMIGNLIADLLYSVVDPRVTRS
jgi:peptide/nickel transport system permease protein